MKRSQHIADQSGLTLVELMVALGIFSIVLLVMVGIYSNFVAMQRRHIGEQNVQENLRFVFELVNREARTAYASTYALTNSSGSSLVFRNQNGSCVHYRLQEEAGVIQRAETEHAGEGCLEAAFASAGYGTVSSPDIVVERLRFGIPLSIFNVSDNRLDRQGFVTIAIEARPNREGANAISVQSSVASRQIIPYRDQNAF